MSHRTRRNRIVELSRTRGNRAVPDARTDARNEVDRSGEETVAAGLRSGSAGPAGGGSAGLQGAPGRRGGPRGPVARWAFPASAAGPARTRTRLTPPSGRSG